ncbi:cation diffusion facilitator family transporter [Thermodesulfobacteriota bacterium]
MANNDSVEEIAGRRVTLSGVGVNAALIIIKTVTGLFGNSQALIADAVHSFSDFFTDIIVLVGLKIGRKEPDEGHPFGHARIETLASAIVGIALIATAFYLGIKAAWNIYNHVENHPSGLALFGAGLSIVFKEGLYHFTIRTGRRIKSQLIIANAWHHRSDALSSVAVFLGVGASILNPSWHMLDSFAALLVSFFIVKVGLQILGKSINEITDAAPRAEVMTKIQDCVLNVEGVLNIHDLRVRISGGLYQMETHITVDGKITVAEGHNIANEVERCLTKEVEDLDRVIVHVDPAIDK